MVVQHNTKKTSNARSRSYKIQGHIWYDESLPRTVEVRADGILATMGLGPAEPRARWEEPPPHMRLANLPTYDAAGKMVMLPKPGLRVSAKGVASFIRSYGVLRGKVSPEDMRAYVGPEDMRDIDQSIFVNQGRQPLFPLTEADQSAFATFPALPLIFREGLSEFAEAQSLLRRAWSRHGVDIGVIAEQANEGFEIHSFYREGLTLRTRSLWNLICFMFMYDYRAGKIGVCACPRCVAPYFLKRRKTQKFCESGLCVAWAASQYTLKWWHEKGKKRSKRERGKSKTSRRKSCD